MIPLAQTTHMERKLTHNATNEKDILKQFGVTEYLSKQGKIAVEHIFNVWTPDVYFAALGLLLISLADDNGMHRNKLMRLMSPTPLKEFGA